MTQGYSTDNYTKWAEEFIRGNHGKKKDSPFYLWVCYGAVHGPFTPATRHLEEYPQARVRVPKDIYPPRDGKPKYSREKEQWIPGESGLPVLKAKASPDVPRSVESSFTALTFILWKGNTTRESLRLTKEWAN